MSPALRSQSQETEWKLVSAQHPCPICEASDGCHRDLDGTFACCARRPSEWPLTSGAWLHRIERTTTSAKIIDLTSRLEFNASQSPLSGSDA